MKYAHSCVVLCFVAVISWFNLRFSFHLRFFCRNSNSMENWFCSHPSCNEVMAMKCRTWHNSTAVVPCAKFHSDMIPCIRFTLKLIIHQSRITMKKCSWSGPQVTCMSMEQSYDQKQCSKGGFILTDAINVHMHAYMCVYAHIHYTAHISGVFTCANACIQRIYAVEYKPAELSRPALIFRPIKCVCEGHARPTDIDAMVVYPRIRMCVHTYNL